MSKVQAVPTQYGSLTPYLVLPRCEEAIEFYKKAFNATEVMRMPMPDGSIGGVGLKDLAWLIDIRESSSRLIHQMFSRRKKPFSVMYTPCVFQLTAGQLD